MSTQELIYPTSLPSLLTPKQFLDKHPIYAWGGFRRILFDREANGFNACVRKINRKILINEAQALTWFDSHKG